MKNKHVELVKKWLNDHESVSQEELEANRKSAFTVYWSTSAERSCAAYWAAKAAAGAYDERLLLCAQSRSLRRYCCLSYSQSYP